VPDSSRNPAPDGETQGAERAPVLLHRALAVLVLPATLLLPTGVGAAAPTTAATLPPTCTDTSWVAGSVDLCDGRLVDRDDVYDDEGADIGYTSGTQKAFGPPAAPAGDVRFPGGPGRTTEPAHFVSLMDDLECKIFGSLADDTWVYPGHGLDTTLGAERSSLPEWRERGW